MVATINPCGFLMLPAYIAYYLGSDEENLRASFTPIRGLPGLAITLCFVMLFSAIGLAVSLDGQRLLRIFPVAGLIIGITLAGLGVWLLFRGGSIGITTAGRVTITFNRNLRHHFSYLFTSVYPVLTPQ